jgi:hypothetical protein
MTFSHFLHQCLQENSGKPEHCLICSRYWINSLVFKRCVRCQLIPGNLEVAFFCLMTRFAYGPWCWVIALEVITKMESKISAFEPTENLSRHEDTNTKWFEWCNANLSPIASPISELSSDNIESVSEEQPSKPSSFSDRLVAEVCEPKPKEESPEA